VVGIEVHHLRVEVGADAAAALAVPERDVDDPPASLRLDES
jgi:hypothetical protein